MEGTKRIGWGTRLLVGLVLVIAGAAAATWGLAHYQPAARVLGVIPPSPPPAGPRAPADQPRQPPVRPAVVPIPVPETAKIAELESRLARVENATQQAKGSAGRADALVIAFAARRAIDRGVALGYLENLLVERFGRQNREAVSTIITAAREPVRLGQLVAEYEALGPDLRSGGPEEDWWTGFKRELGSMVQVRRADRPSPSPDARYNRALQHLRAGEVERALAETMRLPGAARAGGWVAKARRYIAAHRALDQIESTALLGAPEPAA